MNNLQMKTSIKQPLDGKAAVLDLDEREGMQSSDSCPQYLLWKKVMDAEF
jgi:hypothetical protein